MAYKNNRFHDTRTSIDIKKQFRNVETGVKGGIFTFTGPMSVDKFAASIHKSSADVIKYYFLKGKMLTTASLLNENEIGELCLEFNLDFKKEQIVNATNVLENIKVTDDIKDLKPRAPIVTVMGHVDHGKTTLLDYIRKSNVTKGEAGGITQHIGAYQVKHNGTPITFLDTPGHEAFSAMRARGASVTDIVVLVVAADDGIKPQTTEAIQHAKTAKVPIIVFVNKMDKPTVNPDLVMTQLSEKGLTPEEWGGETLVIKGSALTGMNVDKLLEAIITIGEMNEYSANPNRLAMGVVIESSVDKGLGSVATVLVKNGTLNKGDFAIVGSATGHIRIMFDENLKEVKSAGPSQPVKVVGLNRTPSAGQHFIVSNNEDEIKELAKKIGQYESDENFGMIHMSANDSPDLKKINMILKTDVHGSLEAIKGMLSKIVIEGSKLYLIRSTVGGINEADINLAKSSNSIIVGFNIKPSRAVKDIADKQGVKILFYNIIYKLSDDVTAMLLGKLDPIMVEKETGEATIQQIWQHSAIGTIAGCKVMNGEINRNDSARVLRDGVVLGSTKIGSMKHVKEVINKVSAGMEFGITLEKFNDLRVGDVIQSYKIIQEQPKF